MVSLTSCPSVTQSAYPQCESSLSTTQDSAGSQGAAAPSQGFQGSTGIPSHGQTQVSRLMYSTDCCGSAPDVPRIPVGCGRQRPPCACTECRQAAVERLPSSRAACLSQRWARAKLKMTPWGSSSNIRAVSLSNKTSHSV